MDGYSGYGMRTRTWQHSGARYGICTCWARAAYISRDCETYAKSHLRSYGGREASLEAKAKMEAEQIAQDGKSIAQDAKAGAESILGDAKQKAEELKQKVVK